MEISEKDAERLQKVGLRIKELRLKAGFTSYENFAIQHDIDRKYYWSIEKGRNISLQYLFRLLDIHKITPEEFFRGF